MVCEFAIDLKLFEYSYSPHHKSLKHKRKLYYGLNNVEIYSINYGYDNT